MHENDSPAVEPVSNTVALLTIRNTLFALLMQTVLLLLLASASGASPAAFTGPVEIQSIQIVPAETRAGTHPEITGSIKAHTVKAPDKTLEIVVIAVVVRPDHVTKSWTWKNVRMRAGEVKSFAVPKGYEIKSTGSYKVDFNVYTRDMWPLHRLSKTFTVVDASQPSVKMMSPEEVSASAKPTSTGQVSRRPAEYRNIGIGLYSNTLNGTGGATILMWPLKHVGLQASYTAGSFTIAEGRLLVRLPLSSGINPYLGVGYLHVVAERTVDVIGIKNTFQDSGISGVIGVEIPLGKHVTGYLEVSGASIDLKKEVTDGTISGTATVKYAPVTVGIGIVYFLF